MRAILNYCTGGTARDVSAGTLMIHEGDTTGHLYVLIEGRLEVLKGDTVVACITEPGAVLGEILIVLVTAHAVGVAFDGDVEAGIGEDNSRNFGQTLAGGGKKFEASTAE